MYKGTNFQADISKQQGKYSCKIISGSKFWDIISESAPFVVQHIFKTYLSWCHEYPGISWDSSSGGSSSSSFDYSPFWLDSI